MGSALERKTKSSYDSFLGVADVFAEESFDLVQGSGGVFDGVVKDAGDEVVFAEMPDGERDTHAVRDVGLACLVLLILVADGGELNGLADPGAELHRE